MLMVRKLALAGFHIFPLIPNTKLPAIKGWQEKATSDPNLAAAWWMKNPDYNIGIHTIDHIVIDQDIKDGGPEVWNDLVQQREMFDDAPAPTMTVWTAGGGIHEVYSLKDGAQVGNRVRKWPGIDIKGKGGYIVGPGSTIDGRSYDIISGKRKAVFANAWLLEGAAAPRDRSKLAGVRVTPETEKTVAAAERYIRDCPRPEEGERNITAFKVAAELGSIGVDIGTAHALMAEWNEDVGLEADELETTVDSAYVNRREVLGGRNPDIGPAFEGMDIDFGPGEEASIDKAPAEVRFNRVPTGLQSITSRRNVRANAKDLPQLDWVIESLALRGKPLVIIGPGGVSKSTLLNQCALGVATLRPELCGLKIPKRRKAFVWNQEDDDTDIARRMAAIMEAFDIGDEELLLDGQEMLHWWSGIEDPLVFASRVNGDRRINTKMLRALEEKLGDEGIEFFGMDPLAEFHELNELDNGDMRAVIGAIRSMTKRVHCATLISAHSRKLDGNDSRGHIGNAETLRGASAQRDAVRGAATLFTLQSGDEKLWQFEGPRTDYARLDFAKANFTKLSTDTLFFRREGIKIANGETVGIARPVHLQPRVREGRDLLDPLVEAVKRLGPGSHQWKAVRLAIAAEHRPAFDAMGTNAARDIGEKLMFGRDKIEVDGGMFVRTKIGGRWAFKFEPYEPNSSSHPANDDLPEMAAAQ